MPNGTKASQETISLDPTLSAREHLAKSVVTWSIKGMLIVAGVVVLSGYTTFFLSHFFDTPTVTETASRSSRLSSSALHENTLSIFHALLPVLGTWVGTVLAFYFSRENFVTAAATARKLVGQFSETKLHQTSVRPHMIPFPRIMGVSIPEGKDDTFLTVVALRDMIKPPGARIPLVTRLPVFTHDRRVKYVLHQGTVYEYIAEKGRDKEDGKKATLKDLLEYNDLGEQARRFSFLPQNATMADAKAAFEDADNCRDVFVTQTGSPNEAVLGWITDVDMVRHSQV